MTSVSGYQGLWLTNSTGNVLIQATGGGAVNLTGTNNYTASASGDGILFSTNGTVQILSESGTITLNGTGARYDIHSNYNGTSSLYVGNRKDATAVNGVTPSVTNSSASLVINAADFQADDFYYSTSGNSSISSIIKNSTSGSAAKLTKSGSGTLTLSGSNTYTGDTTISAGT